MILQFPTPYPDELLYSVLARYHIRSGNIFLKHTMEDLYGKGTITATAFLPSGIHSLISRLPKNTTLDEKMLIEKHTLYPFYSAFLPEEKGQSIYQAMLSDDGKIIYKQSGIMASSISQNKVFKYCPKCFHENLERYSELFWQRMHQLPGHLICLKHGLWLEDSKVPIIHSYNHSFIIPTPNNCDLTIENQVDESVLNQYNNVLTQIERLVNGSFERRSFSYFTEFYRKHLIEKGFASVKGQVKQTRLYEAFRSFYSNRFLKTLEAELKSSEPWLSSISRKHRKSFHPYYHILMLNFLGLDVRDVFSATTLEVEPFGRPNWACLNVVCPDYKKNVIPKVTISRSKEIKQVIGKFCCPTCGFSYSRKGMDQNYEDCYKYNRILEFGPLWKAELLSLLERNLSYREKARKLNVDPKTIIKYEKIINGLTVQSNEVSNQNKSELVESHRQIWLQLQQGHPNLSKTELRNLKPSTYTFLYRYDKEWLNNNSPKIRKKRRENERVNWQERDLEILQRVRKATEDILSKKGNMKRITVNNLGDSIGESALLEQQLDKMSKTKAFIEQVWESEQEYRLRRVKYVIEEMRKDGEVIKKWKVLRKACIKLEFENEVNDFIQSCINEPYKELF